MLSTRLKAELGRMYEQQGDIEMEGENNSDASQSFTKAMLLKPYDENLYLKRGLCWQELEYYEKAIGDFNEALRIRPGFAEAWNGLGNIKSFTGDNASAIEYYTNAIAIKPDYAIAIYNRGVSKADLGDHVGAIEDYNKSLELNPDDGEAYYNRGMSKIELEGEAGFADGFRDMQTGRKLCMEDE